jgi:hypothetical protein
VSDADDRTDWTDDWTEDVPLAPGEIQVGTGRAELMADADRPGGWLLVVDRIRQSYVDLDDPSYLDFEYLRSMVDVLDARGGGALAVTHVGGGACTLARYLAATRPGSAQIVLEPDAELTRFVRARLPLPKGARIRIRPVGGREGIAALGDASADVVVLDAYVGGRVPAELTTAQFLADVARVLRADGLLLANLTDGPPLDYTRRALAATRTVLPHGLLIGSTGVLGRRRVGNIVLAASRSELPTGEVWRAAASAMFPTRVLAGRALAEFVGTSRPFTDADSMRSPRPPEEGWRVSAR